MTFSRHQNWNQGVVKGSFIQFPSFKSELEVSIVDTMFVGTLELSKFGVSENIGPRHNCLYSNQT